MRWTGSATPKLRDGPTVTNVDVLGYVSDWQHRAEKDRPLERTQQLHRKERSGLVSCRSSSAAFNLNFGYATNTCDYNCFDVMSADLEGTDATSGGDSVVRRPILSALAPMVVIISLF